MRNRVGVEEKRVGDWAQLEKELFEYDAYWEDLDRRRTKHLFRGLSKKTYGLQTTLQRLSKRYAELEPLIIRQFKNYAHREVLDHETIWHWLSIAQHHGLPTRLLDWTNSPYVALHFVTDNIDDFGLDGAVWAINFVEIHKHLPSTLKTALDRTQGGKVFTVDELGGVVKSLDGLAEMKRTPFMLLFEPPSLDDRIVNQYALLSTMSTVDADPEAWLGRLPYFKSVEGKLLPAARKIVIPAGLKCEIRDRLDMMNLTERVILPGIDGLTRWMRRYYGPSLRQNDIPPVVSGGAELVCRGTHLLFLRTSGGWEYVQRPKATQGVTVVAITREGRMLFVEQHRAPLDKPVIELPAGLIDAGEPEADAAKRELKEETGYDCSAVELRCKGTTSPGLTDEQNSIYLALELRRAARRRKDLRSKAGVVTHSRTRGIKKEGERIVVHEVPVDYIEPWLNQQEAQGKIIDLRVYAGLFFARASKWAQVGVQKKSEQRVEVPS